ncbi:hypothetical protein [Streptomyces sp. NPDC002215]|uniref:hypothetical protein n=1 Tax=Streptomyces sp. NPDC002215 TaxID=3154412 RepID=UPI0033245FB3
MLYQSAGYSLDRLASLYDETAALIRSALLGEGVDVDAHPRPSPNPIAVTMERLYGLGLRIDRVGWLCGYSYRKTRMILLDAGVQLRNGKPLQEVDVPRYGTAHNRLRAGVPPGRKPDILVPPSTPLPASAVVELHLLGYRKKHIEVLTGRSCTFVQRHLALAGLPARVSTDSLGVDTGTLVAVYRRVASAQATGDVLHISAPAVLTRLRESGQGILDAPDLDAAPLRIPEQAPWQRRQKEILARAAKGQSTFEIAAALQIRVSDVTDVIRLYQHRDRTTAEILTRRTQGESPGVIAVRMGLRLDSVRDVLARYTSHPRRSTPLAKPPTQ